jgi:hypothetical protein
MNIKHKNLEDARKNPKDFKVNNKKINFGGASQYRDWQLATRVFHKEGENEAISYLVNAFNSHYKSTPSNESKLEDYIIYLKNYIIDFYDLGNENLGCGKRLNMDISHSNSLNGEISRVDKKDDSIEVYLFVKEDIAWEDELRFPLIQKFYAEKYNKELSEVSVGVYCLESEQHTSKKYTNANIGSAINEVLGISKIIASS